MQHLPYPKEAGAGCWNRIGVWGQEKPRCPVLEQVIHCRNCPIFSAAGREVLNSPAPAGYLDAWTETLASPKSVVETHRESVMVFRVAEEYLALPTALMHYVLPMRPVHVLPHRSNAILLGVANVQGRLHVCLSMEGLLGLPKPDPGSYKFILVFGRQEERYGLPVADVAGLTRVDRQALQDTRIGSHVRYVRGIISFHERPTGLLDADEVCQALSAALYS